MAEPAFEHDNLNDMNTLFYDMKKVEMCSLEDLLTFMIRSLKTEIETVMKYMESYREVDEHVAQVLEMINSMEIIQMHFEFVLESWTTKSSEEFQALKEKFTLIKNDYQKINSKEDLTPVPAKYVIAVLHDKVLIEYRRIIKNCFKKNSHEEVKFIKDEENLARLKIITGRFDLVRQNFASVVTFPKDDIFCYEKSSPVWQELYQLATFKEIVTKQEIDESSKLFNFFLYFSHLIIRNRISNKTIPYPKALLSLCQDVVYYGVQTAKVETQALLYLMNPDIQEVFRAWNLAENPWVAKYHLGYLPGIGYDELIYVPRLFPAITKETIMKEYEDGTINKLAPMDPSLFKVVEGNTTTIDEVFTEKPNSVPVRILSYENLNLKKSGVGILKEFMQKAKRVIKGPGSDLAQSSAEEQTIVIHIHGGGFVATSSATHKVYLNKWVNSLKLIHFSIDYRLAPKNKYPDALDDVWQAYLWIINYASTVLGIKKQKVILIGDSAGGNLSLALMLRLIRAGLQPPQGCVLIYPALYVNANGFSPSYFESLDDPMLPYPILKLVVKAYVEEEFQKFEDPFISPLLASPELLEKLPPLRVITATKDPLFDDSWRFVAKLKKLNKDIKLIVHPHLSHGFLCNKDLKNHDIFAEEACELIRELAALNS